MPPLPRVGRADTLGCPLGILAEGAFLEIEDEAGVERSGFGVLGIAPGESVFEASPFRSADCTQRQLSRQRVEDDGCLKVRLLMLQVYSLLRLKAP